MIPSTQAEIDNIFKEIDKDKDGAISKQDLESTQYANTIFGNSPAITASFNALPQNQMDLAHFTELVQGTKYNLADFVTAKFNIEQVLNKYLLVSAPGQTSPIVKRSYLKLRAHGIQEKDGLHSLGLELGIDKPHQADKIKEVTKVLGHTPHEVFIMLKIKTLENGEQLAAEFGKLANIIIDFAGGLVPEFEQLLKGVKVHTKYSEGYTYLIIEVENPLVDSLIHFITHALESVSPECALKFKANISSNLSNLLSKDFDYSKSGGEINVEVDIDHLTMKKLKEIMADNVFEEEPTPAGQLFALLFQELKVCTEFDNLGEALTSALQMDLSSLPKPADQLEMVKEMNIQENLDQFTEGGPNLITLLNQNCEGEGELSINLHDIFAKLSFDIHIKNAFDFLA